MLVHEFRWAIKQNNLKKWWISILTQDLKRQYHSLKRMASRLGKINGQKPDRTIEEIRWVSQALISGVRQII